MRNGHLDHNRRAGRNLGGVKAPIADAVGTQEASFTVPRVTVFRCVNSSRPDTTPSSATVQRPPQPEPEWPIPVHEIALPCTGKLQPEHLLKAFEAGADAVCVITCAGDNCQYLEGIQRTERRVQYVRKLLDEIGLGAERLLVFHLATSAQEGVPPGHTPEGAPGTQLDQKENGSRATEIRDVVLARLGALQPNPLGQAKHPLTT